MRPKQNDLQVHFFVWGRILVLSALFSLSVQFFSLKGGGYLLAVLTYFVYCVLWNFWGWAGFGHELVHNTPFVNKRWNKLYLILASGLSLSNKRLFQATHFEHHRNPHGVDDYETPYKSSDQTLGYKNCVYKVLESMVDLRKLVNFIRYSIMNFIGIVPHANLSIYLSRRNLYAAVINNSRLISLWVVLVVWSSVLFENWLPLLALIAPNFLGTGLVKSVSMLQHPNLKQLQRLGLTEVLRSGKRLNAQDIQENQLRDGLDLKLPAWLRFFYANMNFHATHHRYPTMNFLALPQSSEDRWKRNEVGYLELGSMKCFRLSLGLA
jgi:fatty acid desaturase